MKLKLILLVFSFLLLAACASKKKIVKVNKVDKKSNIIIKNDSVFKQNKTLAIKDTLFISLKTNNKITDSIVTLKLQHFHTSKKSGNNSYSATFDTIKKGLKITSFVKSTTNSITVKSKETTKKKETKSLQVESREQTRYFPFSWWWILILFIVIVLIKIKIL